MFMFGVELFRQKAILVLGGSEAETKDIKRMEKLFVGVIGWKDDSMQSARMTVAWRKRWEHVFPFLSRLVSRRPRPGSMDAPVWGA